MRTTNLLQIKGIKADLIPPTDPLTGESAKPTGETFRDAAGNAHIVYRMSFPQLAKTADPENRVSVPDPETGRTLIRKGYEGRYKVYARPTVFEEEDFILERAPSGEVRINRGFRPTPEEQARDREQRLVSEFEANLAREAVKRGLSAGELVSRLLGVLSTGDDADAPLEAPSEVEVYEAAPGWFNVRIDGRKVSEKNLRREAAEELADTFRVSAAATLEPGEAY